MTLEGCDSRMEKEIISTKNAPSALGPYSQAVRAEGFLFISGQLPVDPSTGELAGESIEDQTRQSLGNIKAILEAAGSSLDSVVKVGVYIRDMDDFAAMNKIYSQYFTEGFPARCCIQVVKLAMNARVEIEAVAIC